jgi:hypothetical protein
VIKNPFAHGQINIENKNNSDTTEQSYTKYIPEGYTLLDSVIGDLNLDNYPDMLLVLKKYGEDSTSYIDDQPEKRPLLILIGQADKSFTLAARNDNVVYCVNCGGMMGDPYMQVIIKKGYFSIEHYGGSAWRWTRIITFKYSSAEKYCYLQKPSPINNRSKAPENSFISRRKRNCLRALTLRSPGNAFSY